MMRVTGPESAPVRRSSSGSGLRVRVLAGLAPELASGIGMAEIAVPPGEAAHLPRGTEVAVSNRGDDTLRLLVVFSPAGFEQGFLGWPAEGAEALLAS